MSLSSRHKINRVNAQKSTGPRTVAGKVRSSQNARKHGLRTKLIADPRYRAELLSLREGLLKENAKAVTVIDALSLAMIEVSRIVKIRQERLEDAILWLEARQEFGVAEFISDLETLEDYERRAHFRLHRAIETYAPGYGTPPSRKQHLPKFGSSTRATRRAHHTSNKSTGYPS